MLKIIARNSESHFPQKKHQTFFFQHGFLMAEKKLGRVTLLAVGKKHG